MNSIFTVTSFGVQKLNKLFYYISYNSHKCFIFFSFRNEEFLIEDNVDFDDIELADEEALLQDEDDILNLNETPDDETLTDVGRYI